MFSTELYCIDLGSVIGLLLQACTKVKFPLKYSYHHALASGLGAQPLIQGGGTLAHPLQRAGKYNCAIADTRSMLWKEMASMAQSKMELGADFWLNPIPRLYGWNSYMLNGAGLQSCVWALE